MGSIVLTLCFRQNAQPAASPPPASVTYTRLTRRVRCGAEKVKHLPVDLQEAPVEILQQLSSGGANDVTHVFFTAFIGE